MWTLVTFVHARDKWRERSLTPVPSYGTATLSLLTSVICCLPWGQGINIYIWLRSVAVREQPLQCCKVLACATNHFSHHQTTAEVLRTVTGQQRKRTQGNLHEPSPIFPIIPSSPRFFLSAPPSAKTSQTPRTFHTQWTHRERLLLHVWSDEVS